MDTLFPPTPTISAALYGLCAGSPEQRAAAGGLPRDAWPPSARPIVDAAEALGALRRELPMAVVSSWLSDRDLYGQGEVIELLAAAYGDYQPPWAVDAAIRDVSDRHTRHRVAGTMQRGQIMATDLDRPVADTVQITMGEATAAVAGVASDAAMTMSEVCGAVLDYVSAERSTVMAPSMPAMTDLIGEYLPGEVYIIAARPGAGKTAYALGEAVHLAARGVPVYIQSLEMTAPMLGARLLGVIGGIDVSAIIRRDSATVVRAADTMQQLAALPIRMWDDSATVELVCQRARVLHARGQCRLVVVDYLQLLRPTDPGAIREQQIAHMSRQLKALAQELRVPVIAVAQLNRASEARKGGEPMLSDLRESGQIEQDACAVLFPHRPSVYDPKLPKDRAVVILAKNRYGSTGRADCVWDGPATRFLPADHDAYIEPSGARAQPPPMPDADPLMPPMPDYD